MTSKQQRCQNVAFIDGRRAHAPLNCRLWGRLTLILVYMLQPSMSYVTFQGNSEIWSHRTGGRLIQA